MRTLVLHLSSRLSAAEENGKERMYRFRGRKEFIDFWIVGQAICTSQTAKHKECMHLSIGSCVCKWEFVYGKLFHKATVM